MFVWMKMPRARFAENLARSISVIERFVRNVTKAAARVVLNSGRMIYGLKHWRTATAKRSGNKFVVIEENYD